MEHYKDSIRLKQQKNMVKLKSKYGEDPMIFLLLLLMPKTQEIQSMIKDIKEYLLMLSH